MPSIPRFARMMTRKTLLSLVVASLVLGVDARPKDSKHHAVDPKDFVYVDGLRLKTSKGLYYLTVKLPSSLAVPIKPYPKSY